MDFVAGVFAQWLLEQLADAGSRGLTSFVFGDAQERALRSAAAAAIRLTVVDFSPEGGARAENLALVINQVFGEPVRPRRTRYATLLQDLQAQISAQLKPLSNPDLTETGKSWTALYDISSKELAESLTGHLVREIVSRGAHGGPLTPLANQIGHDLTHLQFRQMDEKLSLLARTVKDALAQERHAVRGKSPNRSLVKSATPSASEQDKEFGTKFIEEELPRIVQQAVADGIRPAVIFIDVDDLTVINRKFGRGVGDSVLDSVYKMMLDRYPEIVRFKGRCGDDTFYSVLFDSGQVQDYGENIRAGVRDYPWRLVTPELYVTCTIGYALLNFEEDPYEWLTRAIMGMLEGKRNGGDAVQEGPQFSGKKFQEMQSSEISAGRPRRSDSFTLRSFFS